MGNLIIFFKIPPILKLEVGFFSGKKKFFRDFPNLSTFIYSKLHFCKFEKKSEKLFGEVTRSGGRELIISRFAASFALASFALASSGVVRGGES